MAPTPESQVQPHLCMYTKFFCMFPHRKRKKKPHHKNVVVLRAHSANVWYAVGILQLLTKTFLFQTEESENAQLHQHLRSLNSCGCQGGNLENTQLQKKQGWKMIDPTNAQLQHENMMQPKHVAAV